MAVIHLTPRVHRPRWKQLSGIHMLVNMRYVSETTWQCRVCGKRKTERKTRRA